MAKKKNTFFGVWVYTFGFNNIIPSYILSCIFSHE